MRAQTVSIRLFDVRSFFFFLQDFFRIYVSRSVDPLPYCFSCQPFLPFFLLCRSFFSNSHLSLTFTPHPLLFRFGLSSTHTLLPSFFVVFFFTLSLLFNPFADFSSPSLTFSFAPLSKIQLLLLVSSSPLSLKALVTLTFCPFHDL